MVLALSTSGPAPVEALREPALLVQGRKAPSKGWAGALAASSWVEEVSCAPPLCLQGSTEQKPGDSQEQLAKLSSARVASKLRQSRGPKIKAVSHPSRRDHGEACRDG